MVIKIAETDSEISRCYDVMVQLRPDLTREGFVARIRELEGGGYELAYLEDEQAVRAVAGFRIGDMLHRGRHLYVDDLVTDASFRSRTYGSRLLGWLVGVARARGCRQIDLDSGVQRHGAHRFYFRQGMTITSYHFRLVLEAS
jgi:GNAT superfamily N-acetyltransferase